MPRTKPKLISSYKSCHAGSWKNQPRGQVTPPAWAQLPEKTLVKSGAHNDSRPVWNLLCFLGFLFFFFFGLAYLQKPVCSGFSADLSIWGLANGNKNTWRCSRRFKSSHILYSVGVTSSERGALLFLDDFSYLHKAVDGSEEYFLNVKQLLRNILKPSHSMCKIQMIFLFLL